MKRRDFIKLSGLATVPLLAPRLVFSQGLDPNQDILIVVYQRGAADGLNLVVPHADPDYYNKRPSIAIPPPGSADGALDLDGFFGLNPNMAALLPLYQAGQLAMIHAAGSPDPSRSHFVAQDFMELGTPGTINTPDGWLNRFMVEDNAQQGVFDAVGIGRVQLALKGQQPVIGLNTIDSYRLNTPANQEAALTDTVLALYDREDFIDQTSQSVLNSLHEFQAADPGSIPIDNGAEYPASPFGSQLQELAQLIKADMGLQVACVDTGGWDHHDQLTANLTPLAADFANTLAAFHTDMGDAMNRITVITMTEFGRRVAENASAGTDHGHGGVMFAMGGGVNGGQVYADWPGLADHQLFDGDLAITTDYRTVLADLLQNRMNASNLAAVFPDFTGPMSAGIFQPKVG